MPGQAVVRIKDKQWSVAIANTYAELTTGLSGVESIPQQTGVLFDLGYDQKYIEINMTQMLFPLDIIFINSTQGVVGVLHNVQPGEEASLQNEALPGARCFLEINAGEAEGIEVEDSVNIQGYIQPAQFDIGNFFNLMFIIVMGIAMFKVLKEPKKRPKIASATPRIEPELQEKKLALENTGREIARQAGIEFVRLGEGWQPKYSTPRYWFKDTKGREIIATDLKELEWKLSVLQPQLLPQALPSASEGGKYAWLIIDPETGEIMIKEDFSTLAKAKESAKAFAIRRAKYAGEHPVTLTIYDRSPGIGNLGVGIVFEGRILIPEGKIAEQLKETKVIPVESGPRRPKSDELEYLADSPEFLAQTIEDIGYREKLDTAFQEAIKRARGCLNVRSY